MADARAAASGCWGCSGRVKPLESKRWNFIRKQWTHYIAFALNIEAQYIVLLP